MYESTEIPYLRIVDGSDSTGKAQYNLLTHISVHHDQRDVPTLEDAYEHPFGAFLEKAWVVLFGILQDVWEKDVLVLGDQYTDPAIAFAKLGARVTYTDKSKEACSKAGAFACGKNLPIKVVPYTNDLLSTLDMGRFDLLYAAIDLSYATDDLCTLFQMYQRFLKPGGLIVTIDSHPFYTLLNPRMTHASNGRRRYDDLRLQPLTGHKPWRFSDFTRSISTAKLKTYAFLELHVDDDPQTDGPEALYGKENRMDPQHPDHLCGIPRWLVCYAIMSPELTMALEEKGTTKRLFTITGKCAVNNQNGG